MIGTSALTQRISPVAKSHGGDRGAGRTHTKNREVREYQVMFCVMFAYFLLLGLLTFFLPDRFRPFSGSGAGRFSIISNARRAAHEITPFMFMR